MRKLSIVVLLVLLVPLLAACGQKATPQAQPNMANPASVNCGDKGGTLEIRKDADGNEVGICKFDDGSECEEWAFFRGECSPGSGKIDANMPNPAAKYCVDQGGQEEIRKDDQGNEYGVCKFSDGSECDEWAFFRDECKPGNK